MLNNQHKEQLIGSLNDFCNISMREKRCAADECDDCPIYGAIDKIRKTDLDVQNTAKTETVRMYFDLRHHVDVFDKAICELGLDPESLVTDDCLEVNREDIDRIKKALPNVQFFEKNAT